MIIFTPLQYIPDEYLEAKGIKQVLKYNLTSYYQAPNLQLLIPNPNYISEEVILGDASDPSFDMEYHNYILTNPEAFNQLMSIVIPAYTSPDTLIQIMTKQSEYRDVITESLAKLIQQRYGYNVCIVNDLDDFMYATESDFSIPGLFTMDQDVARWQSYNGVSEYEE